ncbi:MAG: gliding motility-associated protein GldE [Bacteroidales bacterium]|nr:gliding motility-associated protein GldE [Bacteroidales bacterium]
MSPGVVVAFVAAILLLICSALISGSEVAFFSLNPNDIEKLRKSKLKSNRAVIKLIEIPDRLLATILVANNFVNIAIVIISAFITNSLFDFSNHPALGIIIQVGVITFIILFFGEILPKIYATHVPVKFARFMAGALRITESLFRPLSYFLISFTSVIKKKVSFSKMNLSMDELSNALDLAEHSTEDDTSILKGIVKFVNINVREIMTTRVDVVGVDINTKFKDLIALIVESGYSRIPVYEKNFDNIKGILYIKDLLTHLHKPESFNWQSLVRPPYFVPETKKIDDLLKEFQTNKIHLAIVIDEYGGTSGIITLEDILEEIVGEITDETDEISPSFVQIDTNKYIFEGKILLNDFYKVFDIEEDIFEQVRGDADTLAGLILEMKGEIPKKNDKVKYKNFEFKVIAVDTRRIKKIQVTVNDLKKKEHAE